MYILAFKRISTYAFQLNQNFNSTLFPSRPWTLDWVASVWCRGGRA